MTSLTPKQRTFLQALAHDKKPIVLVGHKGISDAVVKETQGALLAHELIKVRLAAAEEGGSLDDDATALAERSGAALVARLGRVVILYRRHPDTPRIKLPKPKKGLFDVTGG